MKCPNCYLELRKVGNIYHCPQCPFNTAGKDKDVEELYAWLAKDPINGTYGIIAIQTPIGVVMSMVNSEYETIVKFEPDVIRAARSLNTSAQLVHFTGKKILKEVR